jgi:hypothetical protein
MEITAWVITRDYFAEEDEKEGRPHPPMTHHNTVGLCSRNFKPVLALPVRFRLSDDDGEVLAEGRMGADAGFEPLDQLGTDNWGCTTLEYRKGNGPWTQL